MPSRRIALAINRQLVAAGRFQHDQHGRQLRTLLRQPTQLACTRPARPQLAGRRHRDHDFVLRDIQPTEPLRRRHRPASRRGPYHGKTTRTVLAMRAPRAAGTWQPSGLSHLAWQRCGPCAVTDSNVHDTSGRTDLPRPTNILPRGHARHRATEACRGNSIHRAGGQQHAPSRSIAPNPQAPAVDLVVASACGSHVLCVLPTGC